MTFMNVAQDDVPPVVEAIYARGSSVLGAKRTDDGRVELTLSPQRALSVLWVPIAAHPSTAVGVVPVPTGLPAPPPPPMALPPHPLQPRVARATGDDPT